MRDKATVHIHVHKVANLCVEEVSPPLLQVSTQPEIVDDPCKDVKYKEATVDSMRAQKDEVHSLFILFIIIHVLD